jgi:MSHA biogenesis protein MshP
MKRNTLNLSARRPQRGVSVIAAIFLLLLMAGLAAFMAQIISATHINQAIDISGSRAYQAARTGGELGLYKVMREDMANSSPASAGAALANCFAPFVQQIDGHSVQVVCAAFGDYQEAARNIRIYRVTATATAVGPAGGIERQMVITMEKCRDSTSTVAPYDC